MVGLHDRNRLVKSSTTLANGKDAFRDMGRVLKEGGEDVIGILGEGPNGVDEAN